MNPVYLRPLATVFAFVVVLVLCYFGSITKIFIRKPKAEEKVLLIKALASLSRVADFFLSDYQNMNIDAVFAVRMCQGSLLGALHDCSLHVSLCPDEVRLQITDINDRLNLIHDKAAPIIQKQDEEYYNYFVEIIKAPFVVPYIPEQLTNCSKETDIVQDYNGDTGDFCFANLLGAYNDSIRIVPKCTITGDCWEFMTKKGTNHYYITHELLYTIFGQHAGCDQELESHLLAGRNLDLRGYQRQLCQQIFLQALSLEHNATVDTMYQDLFMEQIGLCAFLGFQNFLKKNWIRMILGWQTASGCFSNHFTPEATDPPAQTTANHLQRQQRDRTGLMTMGEIRQKRNENNMTDGCLSHKTGMAAFVLGSFIRRLVAELPAES